MNDKFSDIIKRIRKENNITQKQLADKYHITSKTVSNWENDRTLPDESLKKKIYRDFKINKSEVKGTTTTSKQEKIEVDSEVLKEIAENERLEKITISEVEEDIRVTRNKIYTVSILALALLIACTLSIKTTEPIKEFKVNAIEPVKCMNSGATANAYFDKEVNVVYLKEVIYCEEEDKNLYERIEAKLYERINDNNVIELSSDSYYKNSLINIDTYLKNLVLNISNINCGRDIFLEIKAEGKDNLVIKKIPLVIENSCV